MTADVTTTKEGEELPDGQWYSNKDLFELIANLQTELQDTRHAIKKYNGLYSKLNNVKEDVDEIKAIQEGKSQFGDNVKSWGGWLIGLITMIFMIIKFYGV